MVEFVINSTINESTGFTPFELTYGNMPHIINQINPTVFNGVCAFADKALANLVIVHDSMITSRLFQTHYSSVPLSKQNNSVSERQVGLLRVP